MQSSNACRGLYFVQRVTARHGGSFKQQRGTGRRGFQEYQAGLTVGTGWPDGLEVGLMIQEGGAGQKFRRRRGQS